MLRKLTKKDKKNALEIGRSRIVKEAGEMLCREGEEGLDVEEKEGLIRIVSFVVRAGVDIGDVSKMISIVSKIEEESSKKEEEMREEDDEDNDEESEKWSHLTDAANRPLRELMKKREEKMSTIGAMKKENEELEKEKEALKKENEDMKRAIEKLKGKVGTTEGSKREEENEGRVVKKITSLDGIRVFFPQSDGIKKEGNRIIHNGSDSFRNCFIGEKMRSV